MNHTEALQAAHKIDHPDINGTRRSMVEDIVRAYLEARRECDCSGDAECAASDDASRLLADFGDTP